jgi:hypothetical protein
MNRRQVTAFIDWNSQLSNAHQKSEQRVDRQVIVTLDYITKQLSKILEKGIKNVDIFNVVMRVYYGWHSGLTPTPTRDKLENLIANQEAPFLVGKTRFDWQQPFGDVLLSASEHRLHPRIRVHLPNQFRTAQKPDERHREKMVDAALICDLLYLARTEPEDIRVIMAEDDDFIPAVFVGEQWAKDRGGRTLIARVRRDSPHLNLDGLIWNL